MESLIASAILLVVILAVSQAITAGQQHAFEAQQRIAGTLAAEDLMGRIIVEEYDSIGDWDGYTEQVGTMTDIDNESMPKVFNSVGREAVVTSTLKSFDGLNVNVAGYDVVVRAFDEDGRVLAELQRFIAEPAGN